MKNTFRNALVIVASFVFVITIVNAANTWKGPISNPPNDNTDAPVNVGPDNQVKAGGLGVASLLVLGKAISASTVDGDLGGTLVTKDYLDSKLAGGGSGGVGTTPTTYFTRFTYTASDGAIDCYPFGSSCTYDAGTGKGMFNGKVISVITTGDAACALNGGRCVSVGYDKDKYAFCSMNTYQSIINSYSDPFDRWSHWSGMGAQCIK